MTSFKEWIRKELAAFNQDLDWLRNIPLHVLLRFPVFLMFLGLWIMLANVLPNGFFSGPDLTIDAFFLILGDNRQEFIIALGSTLFVYTLGLALAAVVGILVGAMFGSIPLVSRTMSPFVNALAALPVIALIPLIILMLGLGWHAKVLIIALGSVMPIVINTQIGVQSLEPELREMARAYNIPMSRCIWHFYVPAALPYVMAGLRIGAIAGLVTSVIADFYTAMTGLGALLQAYGNSFRMDRYMAVVLTYGAIGVVYTGGISLLEKRFTPSPLRR
jgi:ABC-type nitrate/sulfonate/bicarbonate transport system permease component